MNKKKMLILVILCIIGIFGLVGCKVPKPQNIQEQKEQKEKELRESFLHNLSKKDISQCEKILNMGINSNYKDGNEQTLYSKAVNIVLKDGKENIFLSKYFPIFDKMANDGADKSLVKIDNKESLNDNQKNFLGAIGIDVRTQEEKDKEYAETIVKVKEEEKNKAKQNFSMNGLELIEKGTTNDGRYITGKLRNNNSFDCSYVEVKAKITDDSGNVLDTPFDNITNLKSGETWSFSIPVIIDSAYNYQIIEMNCR